MANLKTELFTAYSIDSREAVLPSFDRDTGLLDNFQPEMNASQTSSADFNISFFAAGTNTPISVDFAASGLILMVIALTLPVELCANMLNLTGNVKFVSAVATGFTGGVFDSPPLPPVNTDCACDACVINFEGASLAVDTIGKIAITALIK